MIGEGFRRRYQEDPVIHQITDMLVGALRNSEVTPHDLARCAVLAAEIHAQYESLPITVVLRDGEPGGVPGHRGGPPTTDREGARWGGGAMNPDHRCEMRRLLDEPPTTPNLLRLLAIQTASPREYEREVARWKRPRLGPDHRLFRYRPGLRHG